MYLEIVLGILAVLTIASVMIIVIGPTAWDRLMGFNLFASKVGMFLVVYAMYMNRSFLLDTALTFVLLGFISVVFIANYIQKKGNI